MSLANFEITKRLGEGAYSSVYLAKRNTDSEIYALKKVRMLKLSDKEKENALNEVRILASIQHPNIVAYKEAFIDEPSSSLCIIMEYADNGDLFQKITEHQKGQSLIKEDDIWKMFIQIVRGLKCLHEMQILHRDLKSANVFLNKDGTAKVGDMNVSKVAKKGLLYTQTGTPYYASPEVWRDQPYDHKSDIWSLGCVLYESITLKPPFRAEDMQGLYKKVLKGIYPKIPHTFSLELAQLVKTLIQVSPQQRPSCEKILDLPIIRKRTEKFFPIEHFYETQSELLNTIRVPQNFLYLTDRLPKPNYENSAKKRRDEEEKNRRKTHEVGQPMLPNLKNGKNRPTLPPQSKNKQGQKISINRMRAEETSSGDIISPQQIDQGVIGKNKQVISSSQKSLSVATREPNNNREIQLDPSIKSQQRQASVISTNKKQTSLKKQVPLQQDVDADDDDDNYNNEKFEVEESVKKSRNQNQIAQNPTSKTRQQSQSHASADKNNNSIRPHESPKQQIISSTSPESKNSSPHKASPSPEFVASGSSMPLSTKMHLSENVALKGEEQQSELNYREKVISRVRPVEGESKVTAYSKKNLVNSNMSNEKPLPDMGIKKEEKDLIMRRYKYNHHQGNAVSLSRVALIYGQQISNNPSHNNYSPPPVKYNGSFINNSPYIGHMQQNGSNLSGIIVKPKKLRLEDNDSQSQQFKLPRIQSLGKSPAGGENSLLHQKSKMLPPLSGSGGSTHILLNKGATTTNQQNQQNNIIYPIYALKPSKIKIANKALHQGSGSEKVNLYNQNQRSSGIQSPPAGENNNATNENQLTNMSIVYGNGGGGYSSNDNVLKPHKGVNRKYRTKPPLDYTPIKKQTVKSDLIIQ